MNMAIRQETTSTAFQAGKRRSIDGGYKFPASGSKTRVRVNVPRSPWVVDIETRFNQLTALQRGWDGYSGVPVSFTCANFAANLLERLFVDGLPKPALVPGSDGTVQIEWHVNGYDVEIDILGPYEVSAARTDHISGDEEEIDLITDFSPLEAWLRDLARPRAVGAP